MIVKQNIAVDTLAILVCGDKGGSTTKMAVQFLNSSTPQSVKHARLIGMYEGEKDNRECIENVSKIKLV